MPLWHVYHPPGTFTTAPSKSALAKDITKVYASLPTFYVVVIFHALPAGDIFVGGVPQSGDDANSHPRPFIRLVGENIAIKMPDQDVVYAGFCKRIDEALKPHIEDQGYDWEYHIDETERRLWKIQGLAPPPHGSKEERVWTVENRATPWEKL